MYEAKVFAVRPGDARLCAIVLETPMLVLGTPDDPDRHRGELIGVGPGIRPEVRPRDDFETSRYALESNI